MSQYFYPLFVVLFLACLFSCKKKEEPIHIDLTNDKLEQKLGPNNHYFSMRAYPDQDFDFLAYKKALVDVSASVKSRTHEPGFENEWETQGPGNIGARVNSVAVNPENESIIYAGFSHGGVFKTTDGGMNWSPIFDNEAFLSIGHICLDPTNPDIVYVGTGDVNIPGGFFIGNGIYKSINGGETWENIGLENNGIISKILVNPQDPKEIYASAMGHPSVPGNDRGLYKSNDGGTTWNQILFIEEATGIIDFVLKPDNPSEIIAAGWERIRTDFESRVSGFNGGIWKSIDSGSNWEKLDNGLPQDPEIGRIGLDITPSNPSVVYSVYVSEANGLLGVYKSDDFGISWTQVVDNQDFPGSPFAGFGWYFGKIRVNPNNEDEIFLLGVNLWKSENGGRDWEQTPEPWRRDSIHVDNHDFDFLPSGKYVLATDGGIYEYEPVSDEWKDIEDIPATQFYRVRYNPHRPNLYYGGAQDNGTTNGSKDKINSWRRLRTGDGFQPVFHPLDSNIYYFEANNGAITGTVNDGKDFFPASQGLYGETRNWDMPYFMSTHNPNVFYAGAQGLFRSENGAEPIFELVADSLVGKILNSHFTISALSESLFTEGEVFAGTTNGKVWRTQFNGTTSDTVNISSGLPNRYVTSIKTSPTNSETLYITHSGYRYNEFLPRIHRSDDKGNSWIDISSNLPNIGINDVFIIPNRGDSIIFVATDGGVYGTINRAESWHRLGINMPMIPVNDLEFNLEKNELAAATYARSIMSYDLDDILSVNPPVGIYSAAFAEKPKLKIFPNPATDVINIDVSENDNDGVLKILNTSGKVLKHEIIKNQKSIQFDISNFSSGRYYLIFEANGRTKKGSFIKK